MTTTQTILYIFILIGGALLAQFLLAYAKWKQQHTAALKANSQILDTARGPLEYTSIGQGPLIVVLHGTPGDYDQASIFAQLLALPDFECLSISRPGYLRTPLSTGQTPAQQADALYPSCGDRYFWRRPNCPRICAAPPGPLLGANHGLRRQLPGNPGKAAPGAASPVNHDPD